MGIELDMSIDKPARTVHGVGNAPGTEDIRHFGRSPTRRRPRTQNASHKSTCTVAATLTAGQIVVPGFGPPMTLSDVPRSVAAGGLHLCSKTGSTRQPRGGVGL